MTDTLVLIAALIGVVSTARCAYLFALSRSARKRIRVEFEPEEWALAVYMLQLARGTALCYGSEAKATDLRTAAKYDKVLADMPLSRAALDLFRSEYAWFDAVTAVRAGAGWTITGTEPERWYREYRPVLKVGDCEYTLGLLPKREEVEPHVESLRRFLSKLCSPVL